MRIRTKGDGPRGEILDENGDVRRTRKQIIRCSKELRSRQTPAEIFLWERLKENKLNGRRFYRQHPIDRYIVDFYCPKRKLVIELDGGIHDEEYQKDHDTIRTTLLRSKGCRILRFRNTEIFDDIDAVLQRIMQL